MASIAALPFSSSSYDMRQMSMESVLHSHGMTLPVCQMYTDPRYFMSAASSPFVAVSYNSTPYFKAMSYPQFNYFGSKMDKFACNSSQTQGLDLSSNSSASSRSSLLSDSILSPEKRSADNSPVQGRSNFYFINTSLLRHKLHFDCIDQYTFLRIIIIILKFVQI